MPRVPASAKASSAPRRLVEQLLALARSEPGAAPAARERVDLAEIARRMVAETVPFAASRRIEFELTAPAPAFIVGDPVALGLLVRNLVDNAARYSPPGSRVEVAVDADANAVSLTVDDAGPGIPEAERQRVFDRFYRRAERRRIRYRASAWRSSRASRARTAPRWRSTARPGAACARWSASLPRRPRRRLNLRLIES